ncbi:hypothetical protein IW248_001153 [Micromonospora ureilytica]|uniref:Uncharacterized protein n=1 Tax=Micromonospora ureilytica TaxID=709868 RepID=A0ABS0JCW1_9ACTN|nr:hypothetical protein [Micromonospora ureilytica]
MRIRRLLVAMLAGAVPASVWNHCHRGGQALASN